MNVPGIIANSAMATFAIAIAGGVYRLYRVKKARREHYRSARTPAEVSRSLPR